MLNQLNSFTIKGLLKLYTPNLANITALYISTGRRFVEIHNIQKWIRWKDF